MTKIAILLFHARSKPCKPKV